MKRNVLTITIGAILVVIFVLLLFTFQVRQTEVAVVTTFDSPTSYIMNQPGLKWKWPRPIQKVYKFDQRVHDYEGRFEQTLTKDNYPLLIMLYVGWTISNPTNFFNSFPGGKASEAEPALGALIENGKNEVIGKHSFSHFVSTDEKELKFVETENEVLQAIQPLARDKYGIEIKFVGIKKLGLPESVTEKVFARMQAERDSQVTRLKAEGEAAAINVRSTADRDRDKILAEADAKAKSIRGDADAESAKWLAVFEQDPKLANFIFDLKALEQVLKDKTTLILDERTSPLNLLVRPPSVPSKPQPGPSLADPK
jgi:membrane protease subunit HflC